MATHKDRILLKKGQDIGGYVINSLLGQGGFGDVYKVVDSDGNSYAMKTEYLDAPKRALKGEVEIMKKLHGPCFPKIYADGETENVYYLVMQLLGPSIGDVRRAHQNCLGNEFIYNFAIQSLEVIHQFHDCGFIHRDIKPSNFLLQRDQVNPLMLIDFGLSKPYIDFDTHELLPPANGHYIGTKKYAPLNAHMKNDLGRCDDLTSWFYTLLEMRKGRLPWRNVKELDEVATMKENQTAILARPYPELNAIYHYLSNLNFEDEPDYEYLRSVISNEMIGKGYYPENFDWINYYDQQVSEEEEEENKNNANDNNEKKKEPSVHVNENVDNGNQNVEEPGGLESASKKSKKHKKAKKEKKEKKHKKDKKNKAKNRDIEGNDGESSTESDGKCCLIA